MSARAWLGVGLFLVLLTGLAFGLHELTRDNTLGSDFYIFWQAGRGFLFERQSPYAEAFAQRSQLAVMKRLATPQEDQLGFAYPPFSILILLPLLWVPFEWAAPIWQAFLIASLLAAIFLSAGRQSAWLAWLFAAFYPVFFGVVLGNFAVLLGAVLLLLGKYLLRPAPGPRSQALAGLAAAWLLVKPQFTWFYVLILVLNALRGEGKRFNHGGTEEEKERTLWERVRGYLGGLPQRFFLVGFVGGTVGLWGGSFLIWPGWVAEWLGELGRYSVYNQTLPTLTILLQDLLPGPAALALSTVMLAGCLLASAYALRRWWRGQLDPLALLAWAGLVIILVHPHGKSYEHIAFLLPLLLWVCTHPRPFSVEVVAWWLGSWVASWAAFLLAGAQLGPWAFSDWPVWLCAAWGVRQNLKKP